MKTYAFLPLLVSLLITSASVRANNSPGEGPPNSTSPTNNNPNPAPPTCPPQSNCPPPDPVVLTGGKFYYPAIDVLIPGLGRAFNLHLEFFRSYSSQDNTTGVLGWGWISNLDMTLLGAGTSWPIFRDQTGALVHFSGSASVTFADGHSGPGWEDLGWTLERVTVSGDYDMVQKFGLKYRFDVAGKLRYIEDPAGHRITYNRDGLGRVASLTDASNRTLTFTYNPTTGRLASMADPQLSRTWLYTQASNNLTAVTFPLNGYQEVYGYDAAHNLIDLRDKRGNHTTYVYNASDQVTRQNHPDATFILFSYNNFLGTSSMTDEANKLWSYEYRRVGLVTKIIDPENGVWHYDYNSANELTEVRDPLFNQDASRKITYTWEAGHNMTGITFPGSMPKTFAYDPNNHSMLGETDGNQHTTALVRDGQRRVTSVTDGRGKVTYYTYSPATGLLATIKDRNSKITALTYDAHGNLKTINGPVPGTADSTLLSYDAAGRLTTRTDALSHATTYTYDNLDRVTRITYHNGTHSDFTYDANGNRLTAKDPINHGWAYTYDTRDRQVSAKDQLDHTTYYGYDGRGLLTSVTDPLNRITTLQYDGARRRTKVIEPAPLLGGAALVTQFGYNLAGELTSLTDAKGQVTQFSYDPAARTTLKTFADGATEVGMSDPAGNLVSLKNRAGVTRTYAYNENNWMLSQNCPTCGASFSYDDEGNLVQAVDAVAGTYAWSFDEANRVLTSTQPGGSTGGAKTVIYSYDNAGRRAGLTYPDGLALSYGYDALNRLTSIAQGASTYAFAYDDAARRTQLTFPGGISGTYGYDDANRLLSLNWNGPGAPGTAINGNSYGYDNADGIISYAETHGPVTGARTFGYDNVNRLVSMASTGALNYGARGYNFDAVGNRTAITGSGAATYTLNGSGLNQYATAGGGALSYDANGNLTADGTRTMTYDDDNRLTQVGIGAVTVNYTYDWQHRLAQRSEAGTPGLRHIYDEEWNVLCDVDVATGAVVSSYIHGPGTDEVLGQIGSQTYYLCRNHLGSTTALIEAGSGAVAQRFTYDEYGAVQVRDSVCVASPALPGTRYLFTGREYDSATGLYNYRHRFYHPVLGRWLSRDPIEEKGGVNLYRYVGNNPVAFIDPLGLAPQNYGSGVNETTGPSTNVPSAACNLPAAINDWYVLLQKAGVCKPPVGPMKFPVNDVNRLAMFPTPPPKFHTTPPSLRP